MGKLRRITPEEETEGRQSGQESTVAARGKSGSRLVKTGQGISGPMSFSTGIPYVGDTRQAVKSAVTVRRREEPGNKLEARKPGFDTFASQAEEEAGFRSWLERMDAFSTRTVESSKARQEGYTSAQDMGTYRDSALEEIEALTREGAHYQRYFQANQDRYQQAGEVAEEIGRNRAWLSGVREDLGEEFAYWDQFGSEEEYRQVQERAALEELDQEGRAQAMAEAQAELEKAQQERNQAANMASGANRYGQQKQLEQTQAKLAEADKALEEARARVALLEELEAEAQAETYRQYMDREDWEELSAPGESKVNPNPLVFWDRGDERYDYINDINGARAKGDLEYAANSSAPEETVYLARMTGDEVGIYNYLYAKEGRESADRYVELLLPELERRAAGEWTEHQETLTREHPVLMSAMSVPVSVLGGAAAAYDLGAQNLNRAITGKEVNYDSPVQQLAGSAETIRGTIAGDLEKNVPLNAGETNVPAMLYQTLMSGADSLAAGLAGPTVGGVMLGASAASSTARDVAARGGTDDQALVVGLAAGVFETLFERVSLGNLQALKEVPVTGVKDVVMNVAKSMGVNASEEMATELANIVFDAIAMGDISNWELSIQNYMAQGLSREEAATRTVKDLFGQVLEAGVSGGLMGAGFGLVGSIQSGLANRGASDGEGTQGGLGRKQGQSAAGTAVGEAPPVQTANETEMPRPYRSGETRYAPATSEADRPRPYRRGVTPPAESESRAGRSENGQAAGEIRQNGDSLEASQGNTAVQSQIGAEMESEILQNALREAQRAGVISSRTAQRVMENAAAMAQLKARQGNVVSDSMTKAQRRQAVRDALTQMARSAGNPGAGAQRTAQTGKQGGEADGISGGAESSVPSRRVEGVTESAGRPDAEAGGDGLPRAYGPRNDRESQSAEELEPKGLSLPTLEETGAERTDQTEEPEGLSLPTLEDMAQEESAVEPEGLSLPTLEETERTENDGQQKENAGAGADGGSAQRLGGPGAGEQAGGLGTAAGTAQQREARAERLREARERQNRVNGLRLTPTSARELGIATGTESKTVIVVPETAYDDAMRARAQRFAREGYRVTYFTGLMQVEAPGGRFKVNGAVEGDRIFIQADNMRWSIDQIGEHEWFHVEAARDPGLVKEIRDQIQQRYSREEFDAVVEEYIRRIDGLYRQGETGERAVEEVSLDILEEIFADAYAGKNAFEAGATQYAEPVREITQKRAAGRTGATAEARGPPEERYSYAGRNAAAANSEMLGEAERLEMQGVDPEDIRQETGWFRGADGLWRFEIDDSGMEYDREGNMRGAVDRRRSYERESRAWERLEETVSDEEWELLRQYLAETPRGRSGGTERERALYQELEQRVGELFTQWAAERAGRPSGGSEGGMLADFIRHDELFRNYPKLKNMPLRFESLERGLMGVYDGMEVVLSDTLRDAPEETLIHEVQHAIQRAEGFASGANPRYWERQLQSGYDGRTAGKRREAAELWEQYYSIRDNEPEFFQAMVDLDAMAPDVPRGEINWDTLEQVQEDPPEWQRYDAAREAAEEKYGDTKVWDFIDLRYRLKQAELTSDRSAYDLYRDTAGEIEARDAAARRTMTEEQRRRIRPNTGNEDTVFAEIEDWMGDLDQEYGPQMQGDQTAAQADTQENIRRVAYMEPVASITGEEFRKGDTDLITQVEDFFTEQGNRAYNPELGEVVLDRRGVKSDIGHGIGRKKAAAFAAVPEVIAQGQVVDYQENWKERGYDTAVIAAPIQIGGQPYLAGVVVLRSRLTNRFYLHEVLAENDGAAPFKTGAQSLGKPGGDTPSVVSILGKIRDVKHGTERTGPESKAGGTRYSVDEDNQGRELTEEQRRYFKDSQIRDREGRLREVYHGTNSDEFTVFDWNETQRADGGWFGKGFYFTFYKGEARMYGQRVLDAYLNIKNPFVFDEQMYFIDGVKPEGANASSLAFMINFAEKFPELAEGRALEVVTGWDEEGYGITKNIPWSELRSELEKVLNDPTFQIEKISDAYEGDHYEWCIKNGPGKYDYASTRARYETEEMAEKYRLDAAVDLLFENTYQYADFHMAHTYIEDIGTEFSEALKQRGYDGVLQTRDGDEVVAFYPEQIKRVDNLTPTTDPDIRYSVDEDTEQEGLSLPGLQESESGQRNYREELEEALLGRPREEAEQGSDLYRPEGMSDEDYEKLNSAWKARRQSGQGQEAAQARPGELIGGAREDFTGTEALEKLGIKIENSVGLYEFIPSMIAASKAAKEVRKETRKAERRLGATEKERNFAAGIAAGLYTEGDIPSTMDTQKVLELADYYWAESAVDADQIRQRRADISRELGFEMRQLFAGTEGAKTSGALVLNNRTPTRNMLHMFGAQKGAEINRVLFDPVDANEAERIRFRNRMHDEVRTFTDSQGKTRKLTREERALTQMVIEGKAVEEIVAGMEMREAIQNAAHNLKKGESMEDTAREFSLGKEERELAQRYSRWLETQEALEKADSTIVEAAAQKYSQLFDQFYDAINDFLVAHGYEPIGYIKGYAPHLQPESQQNMLNRSLQAIGINTDVTRLPSSIAGLTADYKPNKRWNPYFLQRMSDVTEYDIAAAFESYVDYMSDVIYHTDDIMRVRAAVQYFRKTYAPEEIRNSLEQADELRYAETEQKANFLRDTGEIDRDTVLSQADVDRKMDQYVEGMFKEIKRTTKFSDLVQWLDNYANILAGKQSFADRGWESDMGRRVLNAANRMVRIFARAQVAGNISSALNQSAQLPQIVAELGLRDTAAAIADLAGGKLRKAEWYKGSDFLVGKNGVQFLTSTPGEMVIDAMFTPAQMVDGFSSALAVRGKYLKEIRAGKSHREAMRAADRFARNIMGSRTKGSRPLAYDAKNPLTQMAHVFQLEVVNQWEHLTQDLPRDFEQIRQEKGKGAAAGALAGVIVKALVMAFLLNRGAEELYGGTPAPFDLLGLTANFIASGEGLTTNQWLAAVIDNGMEELTGERVFDTDPGELGGEFDLNAAMEDTVYNVSNEIPFLRNVSALLGLGDETLPMPDLAGRAADITSAATENGVLSGEMAAALFGLATEVLPGGRQLDKTAQGLEALVRGGRYRGYGEDARLQNPVEGDFWSAVRAMLFGANMAGETREFYAAGQSGLSAGQTQVYESLVADGADAKVVYDTIQNYREIHGDDELEAYERGVLERQIFRNADLTDRQKLELYRGITGADSRADKFDAMMQAGLEWEEVMDAYDKYAELDHNETMKAGEKATELAKWTDRQPWPQAGKEAVKEQLEFWVSMPAEASRYEEMTSAGLDVDEAEIALDALGELEEDASTVERYMAVAEMPLSESDKQAVMSTVMSDSAYEKYSNAVEAGISTYDYCTFLEDISDISGEGKQERVWAVIDAMDLTRQQKDLLHVAAGYKETTAKNAPWN